MSTPTYDERVEAAARADYEEYDSHYSMPARLTWEQYKATGDGEMYLDVARKRLAAARVPELVADLASAQMERSDALIERDAARAEVEELRDSIGVARDELAKLRRERDDLVVEAIRQKGRANAAKATLAEVRELAERWTLECAPADNETLTELLEVILDRAPSPQSTDCGDGRG